MKTIYSRSKVPVTANVGYSVGNGRSSVAVTRFAACCVGCESRAAEGRREDPTQGTERRGERFRNRNRRGAAVAIERTVRGAARAMRRSRMRTSASRAGAMSVGGMAGEDEPGVAPGSVRDGRDAGIEFDGVGDGARGVEHGVELGVFEQREAEQAIEGQIERDGPADDAAVLDGDEGDLVSRHD